MTHPCRRPPCSSRCRHLHSDEILARPMWGVGEVIVTTKTLRAGKAVLLPGQVGYVVEVITEGLGVYPHTPRLKVELLESSVCEEWWPEVLRRWEPSDGR